METGVISCQCFLSLLKERIPSLQKRRRWNKADNNIQEGDVILKDHQTKTSDRHMGFIVKTFARSDGRVRRVEVKTVKVGSCKTFLRQVSEIVLPLSLKLDLIIVLVVFCILFLMVASFRCQVGSRDAPIHMSYFQSNIDI